MEKENILIAEEWLNTTTDYELKILILTSMLAEANCAYRGTLATMCNWLGINTSSSNNNKNIKKALEELQNKGYIFYKVDGRTYTITISNKGLKNKKIINIRKQWIQVFRNYKDLKDKQISIDWIQLVKVFIYIYSNDFKTSVKIEDLSKQIGLSARTVSNALSVITQTTLDNLKVTKNIEKQKIQIKCGNGKMIELPRNIGTNINVFIMFEQ